MSAPSDVLGFRDAALRTLLIDERPLFPCGQDKAPLVPGGFKAATLDYEKAAAWARENPTALVGVPTGAASGFDVIDVDPRNGGDVWLAKHKGDLAGARCVETRSGGRHYFLRHAPGLRSSAGRLASGVDVRADGGYVVNWQAHGFRVLNDVPLSDWPPAILEAATLPAAADSDTRDASALAPRCWQDVAALGNAMANPLDTTRDTYVSIMLGFRGSEMALEQAGLPTGDGAIREAACEWAERWEGYDGTDERAKWDTDFSTRDAPLAGWPTLLRHAGRLAPELASEMRQDAAGAEFSTVALPPVEDPPKARGKNRIKLLSLGELEAMPDPQWLVDGLVPERSLVVPYGPPKQGKTFIVLSLALHIAAGRPWCGREVRQGGVVYIAGEGAGGLKARIAAARHHHGLPGDIPFWLIGRAVNFSDPGAVAELVAAIREAAAGTPVRMVVIDTLARAMPGLDESKVQDMSAIVAACDALKDDLGCTVMPVHHSGKDETRGARGSSALAGAVDASFVITRKKTATADVVEVRNEFQKDGAEAPPMHFDLLKVATAAGCESLVPVLRHGGAATVKKLPRTEAAALAVLERLLTETGVATLAVTQWRRAAVADLTVSAAELTKDRERVFNRALRGLIDGRCVVFDGESVRLPGGDPSESGPATAAEMESLTETRDRGQSGDMSLPVPVPQERFGGDRGDTTLCGVPVPTRLPAVRPTERPSEAQQAVTVAEPSKPSRRRRRTSLPDPAEAYAAALATPAANEGAPA